MMCNYQSLESKQWSMAAVLGLTTLLSVAVGATVGLVASSSTNLYAPTVASTPVIGSVTTIPVRGTNNVQADRLYEPAAASQPAEEVVTSAAQASFNWAPIAALVALPAAFAAFLLRKSESQKLAAAGIIASAVMTSGAMMPMPADAAERISGLTPCAESAKFDKNLKKEVKALEKREKLYAEGSAPYLALEATKARTEARFAKYAAQGLLCGDDGLPHLISDPGLAVRYGHAGEVFIPTFGFLYVAGYIGTAGRTYLQEIGSRQKPTQNEIIIDVPLASSIAFKSWDWPRQAFQELASGKLLEKEENVPVSRR